MKDLDIILLCLLTVLSVLAFGESCYYYDGAKYGNVYGICGPPSWCLADMGYWVPDRCAGGASNRCCIKRTCTTSRLGFAGKCTTTDHCLSAKGAGHSEAGRCPGPSNVQCCY